jgi:cysteine desulfurase family protein
MNSNSIIYFDNASTTRKKPDSVYQAFEYYIQNIGVSASRGSYQLGIQAGRMLHQTRQAVAEFFGCPKSDNVVFTKNSTEAINLFLNGYLKEGSHVVITCYEHNAVLRPIHTLYERGTITYDIVSHEDLYYGDLKRYIKPNTKLVVSTLASNLTGQIVYTKDRFSIFHSLGIPILVDASQGGGKRLVSMQSDNVDYLAFTGHKDLFAINGVGGLCSLTDLRIPPLIQGGTGIYGDSYTNPNAYPDTYEAGTLNMPAIWSLKSGLDYINTHFEEISQKEEYLTRYAISRLSENGRVVVYNKDFERVPTFCFNVEGIPSNEVVKLLDRANICVRGGIHCAILAHKTLNTDKLGAVRVSLNHFNTQSEVDTFIDTVNSLR